MGRQTRMNSITSPDLLERVNPENKRLATDYLDYLRSIRRSETTIDSYRNDLEIAFVWCLNFIDNKFFVNWSKRNVVSFQNWLINNNGNSPARVRRLKATLSSLSNYIENILDDEYPNFRNIVCKIENPANEPVREKTVWSDDELNCLLQKLVDTDRIKQACFLALAMYSGRRKAELCRFRVSDFDDDKLICGGALYKSSPIKTKGRGGGKLINCYTLAKGFKPYFDLWMAKRDEQNIISEWLFPNEKDSSAHISISTANSYSDTFTRLSGKPSYVHSLRHFFTTSLSKAGIPDSVIQKIVSWESADMVGLYKDIDADEEISMYFRDGEIVTREKKELKDL